MGQRDQPPGPSGWPIMGQGMGALVQILQVSDASQDAHEEGQHLGLRNMNDTLLRNRHLTQFLNQTDLVGELAQAAIRACWWMTCTASSSGWRMDAESMISPSASWRSRTSIRPTIRLSTSTPSGLQTASEQAKLIQHDWGDADPGRFKHHHS